MQRAASAPEVRAKHKAADGVVRQERHGTACDAEGWKRSPAEDERRRRRHEDHYADAGNGGGERHVAGTAEDGAERVEEPHQHRAGENPVRVRQRGLERATGSAHRLVEPPPADDHTDGEGRAQAERDDQSM